MRGRAYRPVLLLESSLQRSPADLENPVWIPLCFTRELKRRIYKNDGLLLCRKNSASVLYLCQKVCVFCKCYFRLFSAIIRVLQTLHVLSQHQGDSLVNMSHAAQTNITVLRGTLEILLFSAPITVPCCVFLFINVTMLFTLRSKVVFCETSRYVLLFNLLCADTMQMALGQLLYLVAACRVRLTYPVCGVLTLLTDLLNAISPLTLVAMSLERFVAVCFPLRHAAIITMSSTALAVAAVWTFSSLNILIRVILLLGFPFEDLESLQMNDYCSKGNMILGQIYARYNSAFTYFLFLSASVAVMSSYVGVMIAARSASTDKASARKARNTLLLHVGQLGLSLSSTVYNPLMAAVSTIADRVALLRIHSVLYVCISVFPRCLSTLIYGIRDQSIRSVLTNRLCCRFRPKSRTRPAAAVQPSMKRR
ncbi:odorant receptor 131-2-like [Clinocottus analis]|uniref:odorant receptor 131-2-like n=1 Tax=Clinocottus analis TaxID=304258 RepID=UPI0035C241ED